MRELAQHMTDLIENSIRAGARRVDVEVEEDHRADRLMIRVSDDGKGMSREMAERAVDPFCTTRDCRRVGLGLPLLSATAERCGGSLEIASELGRGTRVTALMRSAHIDRPPLGDLRATLLTAVVGHPDAAIRYRHSVDGLTFQLDGLLLREELEGVPLSHPAILRWLERYITDGLANLGLEPASIKEESRAEAE